ncbi:hypothetical protein FACS1894176_01750 [Bacteroidia bacterium]|nr:hypothetical protein FACS1894176_01750 [Bacteroidia bacterium]
MCENTIDDLNDNFDDSITYVISSAAHQVFNTEENNIQEFLKYSGLNDVKNGMVVLLNEYKQKFESGSIKPEEVKKFKDLLNDYFAMKKEILLAADALQDMKSDNRSVGETILQTIYAAGKDFAHHLKN